MELSFPCSQPIRVLPMALVSLDPSGLKVDVFSIVSSLANLHGLLRLSWTVLKMKAPATAIGKLVSIVLLGNSRLAFLCERGERINSSYSPAPDRLAGGQSPELAA